jgi:endonuclease YncB( thermonuclease family)
MAPLGTEETRARSGKKVDPVIMAQTPHALLHKMGSPSHLTQPKKPDFRSWLDAMARTPTSALVATALVLGLVGSAQAAPLTGPVVHIEQGDTFLMRDQRTQETVKIRICGIDAPENRRRLKKEYEAATAALNALIGGKVVRCVPVGEGTVCDGGSRRKSRDRIVAQCFVDPLDIADEMVRSGHAACDWLKFSGGYYKQRHPAACVRTD